MSGRDDNKVARCEDCGLEYGVKPYGDPATVFAFTCDDCGGAVEVFDLAVSA